MGTTLTILESINNFIPLFGKFIRWAKRRQFEKMDSAEIKAKSHVLFIDDQVFDVIDRIKEAGWMAERVDDISNLEDERIKRAQVIFVDYKGVGKVLSPTEEGLGIIKSLKRKYPTKRVILYSAHTEFSLADEVNHEVADDILPKISDTYVYLEKIEENARKALSV